MTPKERLDIRELLSRIDLGGEVKTMGPFWHGHRSEDGRLRGDQAIHCLLGIVEGLLAHARENPRPAPIQNYIRHAAYCMLENTTEYAACSCGGAEK